MCHAFLSDANFYRFLTQIDQAMADDVRSSGCFCGGDLHRADYPRKPRGLREPLDASYARRLSFCCSRDGCRRRSTPPSVRFLGRRVYLGVVVVVISAMTHGLSPKRRQVLIETLDIPAQTLARWRQWWRQRFIASRCWRAEAGHFMPPLSASDLPGELLGRLSGVDLPLRVIQLLKLIAPVSTGSWSGQLRG